MVKTRIAAVVVTFNRKRLLMECLNSLKKQTFQLDAIYIIDGPSTDGTPDTLFQNNYINRLPPKEYREYSWKNENIILSPAKGKIIINYVRLYQDLGGSGGFYEGVKSAYENGYNWIWIMDDDAEPDKDALKELIKYADLPDVIALAPTVKKPTGEVSKSHRGYISLNRFFPLMQLPLNDEIYNTNKAVPIDFASFVGLLIKSDAIDAVGFPKKEFFISHDDVEYSLRLLKIGRMYLVTNSVIFHEENIKLSDYVKKSIFGRDFYRLHYNKLWKNYYGRRNIAFLGKAYSINKFRFLIELVKEWILNIALIILFDDNKLNRIWFITSAYLDGLQGKFDNEKPMKIINAGK